MGLKLYPPHIEGTIPAFYLDTDRGTATIVVPFSMNKAVSIDDVTGMSLKIKTVQSNRFIDTLSAESIDKDNFNAIFEVKKDWVDNNLHMGQHYKVQLAYNNHGTEGYFSTIGVIKFTSKPLVTIDNLNFNGVNAHQYSYIGKYECSDDVTEKAYSYCFNLYNGISGQLLYTSGEQIHNAYNDTNLGEQYDFYEVEQDLSTNVSYLIEYIVTTINGLKISSGRYTIMQKNSINPEIRAKLIPRLNFENGYVDLTLNGEKDEGGLEYTATGSFKIMRASNEDGYQTWNEILRFALYGQQPSRWIWKDLTVKQGITYKYALQQYNDVGRTSNRLESDPIFVDFEHAFLYDGTKQLKIKYDPKITNFKNDILEAKMDTIGSQFPFIFRNGNVKYKEFSIAGLLSCLIDDEYLFASEGHHNHDYTSNLTGINIAAEREFKLEVLEWLNNGQPKLFRSPTEGNYIVRLMNVSLAPNDTLGRMLHTFTATAYEIAEYSYKNLKEFNLISVADPAIYQLRWETIELDKCADVTKNLLTYKAVALKLENMIPGDVVYIDDGLYHNGNSTTGFEVVIGVTGSYNIDLKTGVTIEGIYFKSNTPDLNLYMYQHQGQLTYAYYSKTQNRFDLVKDVIVETIPLKQFIGQHDILQESENIKTEIQDIYRVHAALREVYTLYCNVVQQANDAHWNNPRDITYYRTIDCREQSKMDIVDVYCLYRVYNISTQEWKYVDVYNNIVIDETNYSTCIEFNGHPISLDTIKEYTVTKPQDIKTLKTNCGVMTEITYQHQTVEFTLEEYIDTAITEKVSQARNAWETLVTSDEANEATIYDLINAQLEYATAYQEYIKQLQELIDERGGIQGELVSK